jgi:FKBP-type peptidyl-prolyl cis-trans isomerase 2
MAAGEVKNILVPAEEAFGGWRKENILTLERGRFPRDRELRVGQKLSIGFAGGQALVMMVVDAGEDMVTLDGNHPLAGHDLTFALKLEGVK